MPEAARRDGVAARMLDAALCRMLPLGLRASIKPVLAPYVPFAVQRAWTKVASILTAPVPRDVAVSYEWLGNAAAERLRPPRARDGAAVFYVHGGGFCIGSPRANRALAAWLARSARACTYVPAYRLAPEHPYPAALHDLLAAYAALRARGYAPERIALAGDSAGAGLVLALLAALRERGEPLPACALLISPWVDLTLSGATIAARAERDPLLSAAWLARCATAYRGTYAPDDPRLSPLFGSLRGMPPLAIHVGTHEILLDDAARLAEHARAAGIEIDYRRYAGLWHVAELHAGVLLSGRRSLDDAARFINHNIEKQSIA